MNPQKVLHETFIEACSIPRISRAKIIAKLYYGNLLVSTGFNSKKTHPLQKKFSKTEWKICLHAETSAIAKALKKFSYDDFKYMSLFVVRAKLTNERNFVSGVACPCNICCHLISSLKIKEVYFTTDVTNKYGLMLPPDLGYDKSEKMILTYDHGLELYHGKDLETVWQEG